MLKQRIVSAVVLVFLALAFPWLPPHGFSFVIAIFVLLAAREWAVLVKRMTGLNWQAFPSWYMLGMSVLMVSLYGLKGSLLLGTACVAWLLISGLVLAYPRFANIWRNYTLVLSFTGVLVLLPAWQALSELQAAELGPVYTLYFWLLIAMADSSAFFVGRLWGKRKLAPELSPGKTWQGVYGALIASGLVSILGAWYFGFDGERWFGFLLLGVSTVIASIFGDLAESMLKREAGVKDSGCLIPGHGGIFDRIDSITAAAPVFVLFLGWLRTSQ